MPTQVSVKFASTKELIEYLLANYDNIIWKKCDNGDKLKKIADYERESVKMQKRIKDNGE